MGNPRYVKQLDLDRNWIYSPGRYFKLDWATYSEDKECFLVALDLSQIQFIIKHLEATNHPRNWKNQRQLQDWNDIQDFYERTVQCLMAGCNVGELINEIRMLRHAIVGTAGFVTDEGGNQVYVDYTDNPTNGAPRSIRSAVVVLANMKSGVLADLPSLISTIEGYIAAQGPDWNVPAWLTVGLDVIRLLDELYSIIPNFRFTYSLPEILYYAFMFGSWFLTRAQSNQQSQVQLIGLEGIAQAINGGSYTSLIKNILEAGLPGASDITSLFAYDDQIVQLGEQIENIITGDNVVDRLRILQVALNGQSWDWGQAIFTGNYVTDNLDEIKQAIQAIDPGGMSPELSNINTRLGELTAKLEEMRVTSEAAIAANAATIATDLSAKLEAIRAEIDSQDIAQYIDDIENYLKETANILGAGIP